jgi:hypothetical protein
MIKATMMVIRAAITRGVTALPLKRNLVLRFMKEGAREPMKAILTAQQEGHRSGCKGENFLVSHATFPSMSGTT